MVMWYIARRVLKSSKFNTNGKDCGVDKVSQFKSAIRFIFQIYGENSPSIVGD